MKSIAVVIALCITLLLQALAPTVAGGGWEQTVKELSIRKEINVSKSAEDSLGPISAGCSFKFNTGVDLPVKFTITHPKYADPKSTLVVNVSASGSEAKVWLFFSGNVWLSLDIPFVGTVSLSKSFTIDEAVTFTTPIGDEYEQPISYSKVIASWSEAGVYEANVVLSIHMDLLTSTTLSALASLSGDGVISPAEKAVEWLSQGQSASINTTTADSGVAVLRLEDLKMHIHKLVLSLTGLTITFNCEIALLGSFSLPIYIDIPDYDFTFIPSSSVAARNPRQVRSSADASGLVEDLGRIELSIPVGYPMVGLPSTYTGAGLSAAACLIALVIGIGSRKGSALAGLVLGLMSIAGTLIYLGFSTPPLGETASIQDYLLFFSPKLPDPMVLMSIVKQGQLSLALLLPFLPWLIGGFAIGASSKSLGKGIATCIFMISGLGAALYFFGGLNLTMLALALTASVFGSLLGCGIVNLLSRSRTSYRSTYYGYYPYR